MSIAVSACKSWRRGEGEGGVQRIPADNQVLTDSHVMPGEIDKLKHAVGGLDGN